VPDLDGPVTEFYRRMFEQMEELERLGFDSVWVTEHHFTDYGGSISHPPTFLSAVARTTRRIRLGVAVSVLPFHNPFEVAESYAMVDVISNGRLEFGMGRGSEVIEYKLAGAAVEEGAVRMREAAEIIRQAWSDEPVNFRGEFFEYHDVRVLPKPVQRPHPPIWVGASKTEETFRWAAENGYNLMTLPYLYPNLDFLGGCVKLYRDTVVRTGQDLARREILGKFHIYVSESLDRAIREAEPYLQNYTDVHHGIDSSHKSSRVAGGRDLPTQMAEGFVIAGDPQRCIDAIHRWREQVGLTTLSGTFYFGGMPQEMALKNIRLFAERVMPALRDV
jgi:alkanesulfonate monooxygenase SsuD/methylene tetrahydromethanopterin reductase-like flavin-dependent oxidoreductase (luciferase family)